jgi:glycosyltransferase involved in cell wall biosynthesis
MFRRKERASLRAQQFVDRDHSPAGGRVGVRIEAFPRPPMLPRHAMQPLGIISFNAHRRRGGRSATVREESRPRVSIGMPVYNAERYLREALESLLAQTYGDFELLIADNASTDATEDLCRKYAAVDDRIRYVGHRENYGPIANFNDVFRLTSGRYFKWAASDDICAPDFLSRCVEVLDSDLTVVLACPRIAGIDEDGKRIAYVSSPGPGQGQVQDKDLEAGAAVSATADDPTVRWRWMMRNLWWTPHLYGLIRSEVLARTGLHPAHYMSDHILLAELALYGRFAEIPEELLHIRIHAGRTSNVTGPRQRLVVAKPKLAYASWSMPRLLMVYPERVLAHAASVRRAPLTHSQRLACYVELLAALLRWARARVAG